MADEVQTAVIAAVASVAVSIGTAGWTYFSGKRTERRQDAAARDLETLRSRLTEANDAAKAKRDYEYEALKRLYAELYPLSYQLNRAALQLQHRIQNLALAAREGHLTEGADNWITGRDPYYFTALLHAVIAPLAVHELITRRLTQLDLALDPDLNRQHILSGRAYEAMRSDYNLADARYPPLTLAPDGKTYQPPEDRPAVFIPALEERWKWRQGLYSGQISQVVEAALIKEDNATRVMTFAEFAKTLGGADLRSRDEMLGRPRTMRNALRPLIEALRDFHPARRPVTWRILLAHCACCRGVAAPPANRATTDGILRSAQFAPSAEDRGDFDWIGDGDLSIPEELRNQIDFPAERDQAFAAANLFVTGAFRTLPRRYDPRFQ